MFYLLIFYPSSVIRGQSSNHMQWYPEITLCKRVCPMPTISLGSMGEGVQLKLLAVQAIHEDIRVGMQDRSQVPSLRQEQRSRSRLRVH